MLDAVLLTHLHSDHITDLNDVITGRWVTSLAPNPLPIIGPPDTQQVVDGDPRHARPRHRLPHRPPRRPDRGPAAVVVTESAGGVVFHDAAPTCGSSPRPPTTGRSSPPLGYRIEHAGHAVVIGGDGVPCAGLDELCAGADAYVQTVLREDLVRQIPIQRFLDTIDYHSTVRQAGETAARAGVKTLVLTHQVPDPGAGLRGRVERARRRGLLRRDRLRRRPHRRHRLT